MNKKRLIVSSLLIGLFFLLAGVFFFYDLQISKSLVKENPNFVFGFLDAIGEFPIYLGPILFGLVYGFTNEKKATKLLAHFVGLISVYIAFIKLIGNMFEVYFSSNMGIIQYILLAIASLILYVLLFIFVDRVNLETLYKLRDIALIYLIVSITSFLLTTSIKYIWGRPRFYTLSPDYSDYSNYLTIHGFKNSTMGSAYRSFPSGHTNAAASILVLSLIPTRFTNKRWIKHLVNILCVLYPIVVAISGVCVGDHYASDVLFGFAISLCCFITTYIIFKKKGWLYVRNNKC